VGFRERKDRTINIIYPKDTLYPETSDLQKPIGVPLCSLKMTVSWNELQKKIVVQLLPTVYR
jgi:hypothetical protein